MAKEIKKASPHSVTTAPFPSNLGGDLKRGTDCFTGQGLFNRQN